VEFRKAGPKDYAELYGLQNRNLMTALTPSERSDGFLSSSFQPEDFQALNDDLSVVVCSHESQMLGFLVASTIEFNKAFVLTRAMIDRFSHALYESKPLEAYCPYISGPVCIDRAHRGKGIFEGMYKQLFGLLPARYDLALTLVAKDNPRSLAAHAKVGFEQIDQFRFNGRVFYILAVKV
jgi:predicted GNAT superfamily acetyltransferase